MLSWGIGLAVQQDLKHPETVYIAGAFCLERLHAKQKECFVLSVCCFMLGVSAFFFVGGGACITLEAFHAAHARPVVVKPPMGVAVVFMR